MHYVVFTILIPLVMASSDTEVKIPINYLLLERSAETKITFEATSFNGTGGNVLLQILVENENVVEVNPLRFLLEPGNKNYTLFLNGSSAGHTQIIFYSDDENVWITNSELVVDVILYFSLRIFSMCILWIYTICLVMAFYPQVYLNYQRKCVVGLSFDFLLFSTIGHLRFVIFYLAVHLTSDEEGYRKRFNLNSAIYNLHGCFIIAVIIVQCCIYERAKQKLSRASRILFMLMVVFSIFFMAAEGFLMSKWFNWLYSALLLIISLLKFCPQIFLNYKRKTTKGLSMGLIAFKTVAGILELFQLILDSINYGNFAILGSPVMVAVSVFDIGFPVFILVQHYYLYRKSSQTTD